MPAVVPGTAIDRYRIEAVVGAGSMGDVYRGVDEGLQRRVAVKILSERHRDNRELRARFVREARAVAAISHPNVVQVFTTGSFDNRPYIAMEFLDGIDLGSSVAKQGTWLSLDAAAAVRDAAQGLDAAARAGLIHRDVKPTNLVLLQDGLVKVTDFGLAKPLEPGDEPALTAMGVVVGTPDYIAPEQARGERIDHRVDIYALGGTLYFLLTGMPPFRTGKATEDKYLKVVARHLRNPVPDARARNADADAELAELARSMMAKAADERPAYGPLIDQLEGIVIRLEESSRATPSEGQHMPSTVRPITRDERPAPASSRGPQHEALPVSATRDASHGAEGAAPAQPLSPRGDTHRPPSSATDRPRLDQTTPADLVEDDAPTRTRIPRDRTAQVTPSSVPRWLRVTTLVALLLFVTGLGLIALGPRFLGLLPIT